jgi:hypothetical protein
MAWSTVLLENLPPAQRFVNLLRRFSMVMLWAGLPFNRGSVHGKGKHFPPLWGIWISIGTARPFSVGMEVSFPGLSGLDAKPIFRMSGTESQPPYVFWRAS